MESNNRIVEADNEAVLMRLVGHGIEAVGRVRAVQWGKTQDGRRYALLRFGGVSAMVWPNVIDRIGESELETFPGQWLSVVGEVALYQSLPQISVNMDSQLALLSPADAHRKLGLEYDPAKQPGAVSVNLSQKKSLWERFLGR